MTTHSQPASTDDGTSVKPTIALTGATGYVGGRLLIAFERAGVPVVCLTRRPHALRHTAPTTSVVVADVLEPTRLRGATPGDGRRIVAAAPPRVKRRS